MNHSPGSLLSQLLSPGTGTAGALPGPLQVLGHRSATGGLPQIPALQLARQSHCLPTVKASCKRVGEICLPQVLHGLRRSPGGCLFFPEVPCEAAHQDQQLREVSPCSDKARPWGDPGPRAGTLLLSTSFPGVKHSPS